VSASSTVDGIRTLIAGARDIGMQRFAMIVGSVVAIGLLLLLTAIVIRRRRRGRRLARAGLPPPLQEPPGA
jgi:hypothetical protein